ncbi:uncharacterized protein LOC143250308 isoform X2 [Tachypleus tridentatus]|uniref:uncharacterized protein LOC143250308 isoform X2 n=1 Tax=Tachypleus tridentatus TaxID=6853 RepID=UPI003FD14964
MDRWKMCHTTDFLKIPTEEDDGLQLSIGKTGHPQSTPDFVVNILCQSDDPLSPDYVPSIFHFTRSPLKRRKAAELCKYENRKEVTKRRKEQQKRHEAAVGLLDLAFIESAGTDSSCTDSADELEATCDNFDLCTSQYTTETCI